MKTNTKICTALLALGLCLLSTQAFAQTTKTTVTTSNGAFTEYVPGSQTVVLRSQTNPAPLRYVVTKQTTVVDEAGAPIALERITPGSPLSVEYVGTGERLQASRIVVHRSTTATAPVTTTTAPVTTAPVTTQEATTTTTTTRPLTHHEKEAIKDAKHERKEQLEKQIEREKDALDEAKDKLDDEDDD